MPRGVKGSGLSKADRKKAAALALQALRAAAHPAAQLPAAAMEDDRRPLGSVDVRSLAGDALRRYARRAGVREQDVQNLTEDRLRQNVMLRIQDHFDLITEV